jgi:hypothetical protein
MALASTQPLTEMSTRHSSWGGGGCFGLITLPHACAAWLDIWEPRASAALKACAGNFCFLLARALYRIFSSVNVSYPTLPPFCTQKRCSAAKFHIQCEISISENLYEACCSNRLQEFVTLQCFALAKLSLMVTERFSLSYSLLLSVICY